MSKKGIVYGKPNKGFFIEMLTKDITVNKAIFDLIDNAIDSAIEKKHNLNEKVIKLEIYEDHFSIYDNCGGICKEIAINYAFNFGRSVDYKKDSGEGIGRFGIGMKRSIFKLGNIFKVITNDGIDTYQIEADILNWKDNNKNWDFEFEDISSEEIKNKETKIIVTQLYPNIKNEFVTKNFIDELRKEISIYFALFILEGVKIEINGEKVKPKELNLIYMKDIVEPIETEFDIDGVKCRIISGLAKAPDGCDDDPNEAGWYVFCNKRLILQANKDTVTGWGKDGIAVFHNNYAMFRGFVFFEGSDIDKLPLNTTKYGVDVDNEVFIFARSRMNKQMKEQLKFLKKINISSNLNIKKKVRQMSYVNFLKTYKEIQYSKKVVTDNTSLFPSKKNNNEVKISFTVEIDKYDIVRDSLKLCSPEEVGLKLFNYYIEMNEL